MVNTILIIEDDPSIKQMYKMKFAEAKYKVLEASTGVEGIEMAKKERPSIILLDIIIPQLDGFKVLQKLKDDDSTKKIPVILLTNLGQEGDKEKGTKAGAVDYLVKASFTPTQVLKKVEKYIS